MTWAFKTLTQRLYAVCYACYVTVNFLHGIAEPAYQGYKGETGGGEGRV